MPIDEALRDERAQPGREAAATVEVAEDGLPDAVLLLQSEELCVQRLRDFTCAAAGIDGVRGTEHPGPELAHEMIPGLFVHRLRMRTRARDRQRCNES